MGKSRLLVNTSQIIDCQELTLLEQDIDFARYEQVSKVIQCFYCQTKNTVLVDGCLCKSCNGPLGDGYKLVGLCKGKLIWLATG